MNAARQLTQETNEERKQRRQADFGHVEHLLPTRWSLNQLNLVDRITSVLGNWNPRATRATPEQHIVWLFDTVAYRPIHPYPHKPQPFQVEFGAAIFARGDRQKLANAVASIADKIGLDGQVGEADHQAVRDTIAERVAPFIDAIAPARIIAVEIPFVHHPGSHHHAGANYHTAYQLNPSDPSGIISQTIVVDQKNIKNNTTVHPRLAEWPAPPTSTGKAPCATRFATPKGWLVISDIDDSIKITQTPDPIGILQTTFADTPAPVSGMPELYKTINSILNEPAWIYLSASPYNLYPFLRSFLHAHYPPGTLLLRQNSWMDISGLLKTLTQATFAYKSARIEKIHAWLPKRKVLAVGDSTQSDPEVYGAICRRWPGWFKKVFIRKVTGIACMDEAAKNSDERFEKAFEGVERSIWTVFEEPKELERLVRELEGGVEEVEEGE